jgi:hypothetical protein
MRLRSCRGRGLIKFSNPDVDAGQVRPEFFDDLLCHLGVIVPEFEGGHAVQMFLGFSRKVLL